MLSIAEVFPGGLCRCRTRESPRTKSAIVRSVSSVEWLSETRSSSFGYDCVSADPTARRSMRLRLKVGMRTLTRGGMGWKPEVGSRRSEVGGRRSEVGSREGESLLLAVEQEVTPLFYGA